MAQIKRELNNQMQPFYTSELLILPKELMVSEKTESLANLKTLVETYLDQRLALKKKQNIVYFNQELANFPIEEIRRLQTEAEYNASFSGTETRAFVLLNFDTASSPAQNAALKIIEESPAETLILLVVRHQENILPTILSRCLIIDQSNFSQDQKNQTTSFVWPQNYSQAIQLAEQYKDREQALDLLSNLLKKPDLERVQKTYLLQAYQDLQHNQNVQLSLEHCFFSLVHLEG